MIELRNKLTASIVAFHTEPDILSRAIARFLRSAVSGKIVVVDNSRDNALEQAALESGAEYVFTGRNIGYGRGHNIALRRFLDESVYHLVLNADVLFEPTVLDELFVFMQTNPNVGLVMPKVVYPDGSTQHLCKRIPTAFDLFTRRFLPGPLRNMASARMLRYECRHLDLDQSLSAGFLSGCFMFLRMQALRAAGLFDENIFMYMEDVDLTRRIHEHFDTVYYPYGSITHEHAGGSRTNLNLLRYHLVSTIYYFMKWGWFFDAKAARINCEIDHQQPGRYPKVSRESLEVTLREVATAMCASPEEKC